MCTLPRGADPSYLLCARLDAARNSVAVKMEEDMKAVSALVAGGGAGAIVEKSNGKLGFGFQITGTPRLPTVTRIEPGGPADISGVKVGFKIMTINANPTTGKNKADIARV